MKSSLIGVRRRHGANGIRGSDFLGFVVRREPFFRPACLLRVS